ncbi:MAG: Rpn family recombination-promoting nuclease/putative transposase [bacterium]|nr:Rpn family recombination-promoting nuclease/putative transposase [bacterium]
MKHLLTPKLDYVFKRLFAKDMEILLDLVNAVLNFPEPQRIQSLEVKNPTILPEQITDKYIILDILAVDRRGYQYDIEMQAQKYQYYPERTVYYLCRMYANQLEAGEKYESLNPVLGIRFLDYEQFPDDKDFHYCFQLRDVRHPNLRLTNHLSVYMFELPKLKNSTQSEQWGEKVFEWLHFLNHAQEEGEQTMRTQYTNPAILSAASGRNQTNFGLQIADYGTLKLEIGN